MSQSPDSYFATAYLTTTTTTIRDKVGILVCSCCSRCWLCFQLPDFIWLTTVHSQEIAQMSQIPQGPFDTNLSGSMMDRLSSVSSRHYFKCIAVSCVYSPKSSLTCSGFLSPVATQPSKDALPPVYQTKLLMLQICWRLSTNPCKWSVVCGRHLAENTPLLQIFRQNLPWCQCQHYFWFCVRYIMPEHKILCSKTETEMHWHPDMKNSNIPHWYGYHLQNARQRHRIHSQYSFLHHQSGSRN